MRKKLLVICGLFALVGTIAVAAVLGIAGVGKAASKNTCTQPTGQPPDCLTVKVFPGQLTAGAGHQGLIVAKFINQGSATATHTVIKVTLPDNVTAVSVSPQALCSPLAAPPVPAAIITCSFGNVAGGGTAKVSIAFTTTVAEGLKLLGATIKATLTYAEGNDNNGSPTNDSFNAFGGNDISLVDGTSVGGDCASSNVNGQSLISTSKDGQFTNVDSLTSFLTDLACTPIAAGTLTNPLNLTCGGTHRCTTPLSFAILPTTGQATLYIPVSSLANGTKAAGPNKFTLYWFPEGGIVGTPLMTCAETLDKATPGTDTCIVSQTDTKIGKDQYIKDVLKIFGVGTSLADSGFAG